MIPAFGPLKSLNFAYFGVPSGLGDCVLFIQSRTALLANLIVGGPRRDARTFPRDVSSL